MSFQTELRISFTQLVSIVFLLVAFQFFCGYRVSYS